MKEIRIKICGQTNPAIIEHCLNTGIDQQGLIFYRNSPRNLDLDTLKLIDQYFYKYKKRFVGVFVNPTLEEIEEKLNIFDFDIIQLHGNEDQLTINKIRNKFKKDIYKSINPKDFKSTKLENVSHFLIEEQPDENELPGGNNKSWNWRSFENPLSLPFILSGGLKEENICQAISLTGANFVDINSGVEGTKGKKNLSLIDSLVSSLRKL